MKITTELVDYLSQLARLELPETEKEEMTVQLARILDYVDTLNGLDTQGVEPMSHTFPLKNVLREDEAEVFENLDALLDNAPAKDGGTFLVPKTVE